MCCTTNAMQLNNRLSLFYDEWSEGSWKIWVSFIGVIICCSSFYFSQSSCFVLFFVFLIFFIYISGNAYLCCCCCHCFLFLFFILFLNKIMLLYFLMAEIKCSRSCRDQSCLGDYDTTFSCRYETYQVYSSSFLIYRLNLALDP